MTPEEIAALNDELTRLQAKLEARRDQPGFAQNVADIEARIAAIQAELTDA